MTHEAVEYLMQANLNMKWHQILITKKKTFLVPTAAIHGAPDLHFDKGSTINLTCTIKYSPEPPAYIFWYHLDEVNKSSKNK